MKDSLIACNITYPTFTLITYIDISYKRYLRFGLLELPPHFPDDIVLELVPHGVRLALERERRARAAQAVQLLTQRYVGAAQRSHVVAARLTRETALSALILIQVLVVKGSLEGTLIGGFLV